MRILWSLLLWLPALFLQAQPDQSDYAGSLADHRATYKNDFLENERSPLDAGDLENLRFYPANETYIVSCSFERTPDEEPFEMATYSGITKPYIKYGILSFELNGQEHTLAVYRNLRLIRMPQYKDHLFLPFRDHTNGDSTYGGGRYIDLKLDQVEGAECILDFNKAYNPWCCYSDGYNCPVPPSENTLETAVEAGEMQYAGEKKK